jgi:hypothetical protein
MPEQLSRIETELKRAVEGQCYETLPLLVGQYCNAAESRARALANDDRELRKLSTRVFEVLRWANLMVVTTRASWADELSRFPVLRRYLAVPEDSRTALQVDG